MLDFYETHRPSMTDNGIARKRTLSGSFPVTSSATESWRQHVQCRVGGKRAGFFFPLHVSAGFPELIVGGVNHTIRSGNSYINAMIVLAFAELTLLLKLTVPWLPRFCYGVVFVVAALKLPLFPCTLLAPRQGFHGGQAVRSNGLGGKRERRDCCRLKYIRVGRKGQTLHSQDGTIFCSSVTHHIGRGLQTGLARL